MRKPVVDYRELRLSRLNEPRFSHLKLLGGWIIYFALYFLTENLIPVERCHVIHSRLDDLIPFTEGFLIIYCYWYLLIVASLLWFLLYDIRSFKNLQIYIMIVQALAMIIYIFWPSVQMLRPESFERDNFPTRAMEFVYSFDTPTGVFPSCLIFHGNRLFLVPQKRRLETMEGLHDPVGRDDFNIHGICEAAFSSGHLRSNTYLSGCRVFSIRQHQIAPLD